MSDAYIEGCAECPDYSPLPPIQEMIDTGMAWQLEGSVGRQCMDAIQAGFAMLPPTRGKDYWGNVIPSRDDVVSGSPGSREYYEKTQADIQGR